MKKKIIYFSSLTLTAIFLFYCIFINSTYSKFDSANVKNTINYLSSDVFNGRLAGSVENSMVSTIIKNRFISYGLKSLSDSYTEDFQVTCPVKLGSDGYMKISLPSGEQVDFNYGIDFKEDMINFKNNTFTFSNADSINIFSSSIEVCCDEGKILFFVCDNDNLLFRSSFLKDFPFDATIMITKNTYKSLVASLLNGDSIELHIPFTTEEKTINNVIGVIKGSNKNLPPLILTAHYDHLGSDGVNNIYSGALDNASGISVVLEFCRSLSTYAKPDRDIIFVALNAEEFGLLGSQKFAEDNYFNIKNSEVINFDMIGAKDTPISIMQSSAYKNKDSKLLTEITKICTDNSKTYEVLYEDSSDHSSFNNLDIDAITLCHEDKSALHTPNDTIDNIDEKAITDVYEIVQAKIDDACYNSFDTFLYSKKSIYLCSIILISLLIIGLLNTNLIKGEKINKKH